MKKLLVLMMALVMTLSLVACGAEPAPASSGASEFTAEQQALAQEFLDMAGTFDEIATKVNETPEILENTELVDLMNELADEIIKADEHFANPETLTPEVMSGLKTAIESMKDFVANTEALIAEVKGARGDVEGVVVSVEIFNLTGVDIHALALSPANDNNWGDNLITEVIKNGEKVQAELVFTADTLVWDILVQDGSDNQLSFMGVDFSEASTDGAKLILEATEGGDYFASVN